jgi:hypothetical protein
MLRLLPLSRRAAQAKPEAPLPRESGKYELSGQKASYQDNWKDFLRGNYPELVPNLGRGIGRGWG